MFVCPDNHHYRNRAALARLSKCIGSKTGNALVESGAASLFLFPGRLLFLRSLLKRIVLGFFYLGVVNIQTFRVLCWFLAVREGRAGIFRYNVYRWIGLFVNAHGTLEMGRVEELFLAA